MMSSIYIKLITALGVIAVLGYIELRVYNAGKASVYAKLQADRIVLLQDGKRIDQEALAANDDDLRCMLVDCSMPDDTKKPQ